MPSRSRIAAKNSNGGTKSARERQRFSVSAARLVARALSRLGDERLPQRALAAGASAEQIVVVEAEQRAFQHLGERQVVLGQRRGNRRARSGPARRSGRSGAGGRRRRPGCGAPSVPAPSAPRTGVRLRTRIRMSPARIGRSFEGEPLAAVEPAADRAAMRSARRLGGRAAASRRAATRSACSPPRRVLRSARSRPGRHAHAMGGVRGSALAAAVRPGVRAWLGEDRSTRRASARPVRNDRSSGTRRQVRRPRGERCESAGPSRRTCAARRPGSCRSTASRRRPRTACAPPRARRVPAKNSSASARRPATARGSCPAPRRPGCGRGRRRACRAPTRRSTLVREQADAPWRSDRRSRARRGAPWRRRIALRAPRRRGASSAIVAVTTAAPCALLVQGDEARVCAAVSSAVEVGMLVLMPFAHQALARVAP